MTMNRYPSYKPSGVKWLGEIPSHWEMKRWRFLMSENTTKNSNCKEKLQLQFRYGDIVRKANQSEESDVLDTISKYTIVEPDDIMINGLNLNYDFISQRVAQVQEHGVITSAYISLRPTEIANSRYFTYFLKSMDAKKMFHGMGTGIRLTLSYNELKNQFIPCPSPDEQSAIAAYLDSTTAKIDAAIAQQQKMIDLLNERKQIIINRAVTKGLNPNAKMKDSGVEWIGEVPEGWKVKKLKHLAKIFGRIGFRGYNASDLVDEGEGAITLSPSNMKEHKMQYEKCTYLSWNKYYESPEIMIKNGDVLFVKTGSTYGKSCLVENLPMEATINPQLVVFKEFNCSNSFFEYLLQSNIIRDQVELSVIGGTIPTISQEKILNYLVPIPSMEEQLVIVDAINSSCKPLNEAIFNANKQISLLQERKQIIINEVVTGKVKVI